MSGYILYFCEDTDISSAYGIQVQPYKYLFSVPIFLKENLSYKMIVIN